MISRNCSNSSVDRFLNFNKTNNYLKKTKLTSTPESFRAGQLVTRERLLLHLDLHVLTCLEFCHFFYFLLSRLSPSVTHRLFAVPFGMPIPGCRWSARLYHFHPRNPVRSPVPKAHFGLRSSQWAVMS
jgi:hypothetical protein